MKTVVAVVMRQILPPIDALQPGHTAGYNCRACGLVLQASPSVLQRIATVPADTEIRIFCHDCGIKFAGGVAAHGKLDGVEFTEAFRRQYAAHMGGAIKKKFDPQLAEHPPLYIWTIYERPADYPQGFVVRRFAITAGREIPGEAFCGPTLESVRAVVPEWCVRIERAAADVPSIVECWL